MNRINITINSRVYTVVADEDEAYLKRLCDYVNEKVKLVISEGTHVMGEKPLVLTALNICDEYFKLLDSSAPTQGISEIIAKNKQLEAELRELRKDGGTAAEKVLIRLSIARVRQIRLDKGNCYETATEKRQSKEKNIGSLPIM